MLLTCLALGVAALLSGSIASSAQGAIYWVNFDGIGRANLDGSNAEPIFLSGQERHFMACSVAVSDKHIYWGDFQNNLIGRANLDGTEQVAFVNFVTEPCALALDGEHLYWVSQKPESVGRVNLNGTELIPQLIQGQERLCGVAASGGYVYFSSYYYDRIGRATADGKVVEPTFIPKARNACGLAISGNQLFWGSYEDILGRVNLDGSEPQQALVSGLYRPCAVAANGSQLFFVEQMSSTGLGVGSANLDGTSVRRGLLPGTLQRCSVAVDSVQVPAKTPPPPRPIRCEVAHVERNPRTGVAFVLVYTEGGSKLTVTNTSLRSRDLREQQPWNFSRLLKVWPGGKGKAGKRLRQRLRRTGRAELKVGIECATADPTLASSSTEVPLTLRQTPKPMRRTRGAKKSHPRIDLRTLSLFGGSTSTPVLRRSGSHDSVVVRPTAWRVAYPPPYGDTVHLTSTARWCVGGHRPRITNARVRESEERVVITVFRTYRRHLSRNDVCPALELGLKKTVELSVPLGHRRVLDGSTTPRWPKPGALR